MNFKRDHSISRQAHCQILEMIDDGILDPRYVLEAALGWMSDDDVEKMAYANEIFDHEDEDEEEDE
jgi:hypothetical protein